MEKADTVTFAEVALMSAQLDFFVGSYALRALVFSRPAECQVLPLPDLYILMHDERMHHCKSLLQIPQGSYGQ